MATTRAITARDATDVVARTSRAVSADVMNAADAIVMIAANAKASALKAPSAKMASAAMNNAPTDAEMNSGVKSAAHRDSSSQRRKVRAQKTASQQETKRMLAPSPRDNPVAPRVLHSNRARQTRSVMARVVAVAAAVAVDVAEVDVAKAMRVSLAQ